ncbi:MAG TPA: 50S ribosomal protein L6 [Planctomycetota bacterium]|nr:50S ribosomal protein L6 [Planctomycetota bacterium]
MSRIGKLPVALPKGVTVETGGGRSIKVKGPKGELSLALRSEVEVELENGQVAVSAKGSGRSSRAYHGMTRALIANMVEGVTSGYSKTLDVHGVGWNVAVNGSRIVLNVGYCHPVELDIPQGVAANCPSNTQVVVSGADKQAVGQLAASVRAARPPEPYKGKGVRYKDEQVKLKAGKSFGS